MGKTEAIYPDRMYSHQPCCENLWTLHSLFSRKLELQLYSHSCSLFFLQCSRLMFSSSCCVGHCCWLFVRHRSCSRGYKGTLQVNKLLCSGGYCRIVVYLYLLLCIVSVSLATNLTLDVQYSLYHGPRWHAAIVYVLGFWLLDFSNNTVQVSAFLSIIQIKQFGKHTIVNLRHFPSNC